MNYLVKDTDYTLAYPTAEYITAGTKQITINGIGNYCGSKTVSYEVTGGPAAGYNVYVASDFTTKLDVSSIKFSFDGGSTWSYGGEDLASYKGQSIATNVADGDFVGTGGGDVGILYYHYEGESSKAHSISLGSSPTISLTADFYIDYLIGAPS